MESKKIKLKVHYRNFTKEELIVNTEALSREKFQLQDGDVLEIFPPEDQEGNWRSHLLLPVKLLPPDIQSKGGPFSILHDLATAFNLTGVREVCVRRVSREEVGLDLVELSFKDQYITRSDMWRFTCSLLNQCVYINKYLRHSSMRMQTHILWSQGEKVMSGAVVKRTRVVFRSASAHVFLFIQISAEMWDFDPSGEFFFDKAVTGFLRELFGKWKEASCNHDVTIVFFWRFYYDTKTYETLPECVSDYVHKDKRGYYEDFYQVIVEGVTLPDWSSQLVHIKKSFLKLLPLIAATRGKDIKPCLSAEGNILEAINLALSLFERHHVDTNLQISGQQIVIVTAGTGMFDVDRELMRLTNERLIDGGISTDVVSMRDQPLHSMPLFRFHSQDQEFYSIPQWINYHLYKSPLGRSQEGCQPRIYLSDHLVNTYLKSTKRSPQLYKPNTAQSTALADPQLPNWVDYDEYDSAIFDPVSGALEKAQSVGKMANQKGGGESVARQGSESSTENLQGEFEILGSPTEADPFEGADQSESGSLRSNPLRIENANSREEMFTRSVKPVRSRYKSENWGDASADKLGTSSGVARAAIFSVGSAEALRQTWGSAKATDGKLLQKKRISFINPFKPQAMHSETPAYQRRWAHVFPIDKRGVAFQVHHAPIEEHLTSSVRSGKVSETNSLTPHIKGSLKKKSILKQLLNTSSAQKVDSDVTGTSPSSFRSDHSKVSTKLDDQRQSPSDSLQLEDKVPNRSLHKLKDSPSLGGSTPTTRRSQGQSSPLTYRPNTPVSSRNESSGTTEDFSSVRRTGMDWTSLEAPACLPITTDYHPGKAILDRDYVQYNTNLVVFNEKAEEETEEKRVPTWHSDHSTMSTFQAFQEMIAQRLSQGFQLIFCPERGGGGGVGGRQSSRVQSSVFLLHNALQQLKDAVRSKHTQQRRMVGQISVEMGLSRVFQKIVLSYQDISVFIYRPKTRSDSHPWPYSYQLLCAQEEGFQRASCQFAPPTEDYNWNYLDQHVCGYPDFEELGESQRYWELRYLLLPKQPPLLPPIHTDSVRIKQQEERLINNFVRFLEFLNHIKRGGAKNISRQQSLPAGTLFPGSARSSVTSLAPYDSHSNLTSPTSSITPTPTPIPTPSHTPVPRTSTPSHTPATRTLAPRNRKLSEIDEEEEKSQRSKTDHRGERRPGAGDKERAHKGHLSRSKAEGRSLKNHERKPKNGGGGEATIRRAKSGENLVQMERDQRPESPSIAAKRGKASPRTIIRQLHRLASDDQEGVGEKPAHSSLTTSSASSSQRDERESSLDFGAQNTENQLLELHVEQLSCESPLEDILRSMEDETEGVDFLGDQHGLRRGCFLAMDAVKWMKENVDGVSSRKEAVKLLQDMVDEQLLVHASGDTTVPFLDGYFFYCMPRKEMQQEVPKEMLESSFIIVNHEYDTFSKKWFETEVQFSSSSMDDSPLPSSLSSLTSSLQTGQSPYYMGFEHKEKKYVPPTMLNRRVELNPDPHFYSDRPEWCYVHYDPVYNPCQAFQLKFQWMVTTANLLSTLIQSWVHKASMCDFNLVAIPVQKNLSQDNKWTHPFRKPTFIPVSVPPEVEQKWRDQPGYNLDDNINKLLLAIASNFYFLPISAPITPEQGILSPSYSEMADQSFSQVYVHHTGVALITPVTETYHTEYQDTMSLASTHSSSTWKGSQLSNPLNSSTPTKHSHVRASLGSVSSRSSHDGGGDASAELKVSKCGFYWHKNCLLPKQKNIPPGLLAQYDNLYERFIAGCKNEGGQILEICEKVFFI